MNEPKAPLSQHLRDPASEALLQAGWQGLEARRRAKPDRRRPLIAGAGAVALVVAAIGWWSAAPTSAPTLTLANGRPLGPALIGGLGAEPLILSDDSRLTFEPGTEVELGENRPGQLHLLLRRGRLALDVRSHGRTRWRIDAGSTSVEVVGTRFSVERLGDGARVSVSAGKVRVSDPNLVPPVQYLGPGEALSPPEATASTVAPSPPGPETRGPRRGTTPPASSSPIERRVNRRPPGELALDGPSSRPTPPRPTEAPSSPARPNVPPDAAKSELEAEALLRQADQARRRGDHVTAAAALEQVAAGSDARAALAALTLGRLRLDELDDPSGADRALVRALTLPLPPSMEEIAWARRVEAKARQGARAEAQALAAEYQRRFPAGRFSAEVQNWSLR